MSGLETKYRVSFIAISPPEFWEQRTTFHAIKFIVGSRNLTLYKPTFEWFKAYIFLFSHWILLILYTIFTVYQSRWKSLHGRVGGYSPATLSICTEFWICYFISLLSFDHFYTQNVCIFCWPYESVNLVYNYACQNWFYLGYRMSTWV